MSSNASHNSISTNVNNGVTSASGTAVVSNTTVGGGSLGNTAVAGGAAHHSSDYSCLSILLSLCIFNKNNIKFISGVAEIIIIMITSVCNQPNRGLSGSGSNVNININNSNGNGTSNAPLQFLCEAIATCMAYIPPPISPHHKSLDPLVAAAHVPKSALSTALHPNHTTMLTSASAPKKRKQVKLKCTSLKQGNFIYYLS